MFSFSEEPRVYGLDYNPDRALRKAVYDKNTDAATSALKEGANPNYDPGDGTLPTLVLAESIEMISLLLKYGANVNILRGRVPFWRDVFENKNFDLNERYDLLTDIVNKEPCPLYNLEINEVLLITMRSDKKESLEENFNWESSKGKCILSLMRASTDLSEVVTANGWHADPVSWATNQKNSDILIRLMFQNNFILYENFEYEKSFNDESLRLYRKLKNHTYCHDERPEIFFDKINSSFLSLMLIKLNHVIPDEVINYIVTLIVVADPRLNLFINYRQENLKLEKKKSDYCSDDWNGNKTDFYKQYQYLSPSSFFKKAHAEKARKVAALELSRMRC